MSTFYPEDQPPVPPEPTGDEDVDADGEPLAAEDSAETPPDRL
jgi:hypothetical protein